MAGGGYGTTVEEMQAGAQHVFEVNDSVQSQLATLRNQIAPLAGAWKGQASVAFQTLMQRWDQDAAKLNEALRSIGEQIQGSGQTYAQREEEESQSFTGIQNALG